LGCYELGRLFDRGIEVAKDEARAAVLYTKACDGGEVHGCYNLGVDLAEGVGVARDAVRAAALYTRACDGGEPLGCYNLGVSFAAGAGVPRDEARAAAFYTKACAAGVATGCSLLNDLEGGAPRTKAPQGDLEKARLIEHALLMSDLFGIGFLRGLGGTLAGRKDASRILDCLRSKIEVVASDAFALAIKNASTPEQLERGARLASVPAFANVRRYVLANSESLEREAEASGRRVDDYLLTTAAARLKLPAGAKASVTDFVAWNKEIRPKFNAGLMSTIQTLMAAGGSAAEGCAKGKQ